MCQRIAALEAGVIDGICGEPGAILLSSGGCVASLTCSILCSAQKRIKNVSMAVDTREGAGVYTTSLGRDALVAFGSLGGFFPLTGFQVRHDAVDFLVF
jgi:hypothetical protein